jgi:hypothetical protein
LTAPLKPPSRYAKRLAAEGAAAFAEDTLLYNGLAPTRVALRIIDAPAEYAVPVKQDRWGWSGGVWVEGGGAERQREERRRGW